MNYRTKMIRAAKHHERIHCRLYKLANKNAETVKFHSEKTCELLRKAGSLFAYFNLRTDYPKYP